MTLPKQWPIAAAILGLVAVIGTGVKLATSSNPLEARVDDLLARERETASSSSFENLQSRIDDLTRAQTDPGFVKLPVTKQESVGRRLSELKGFKSYQDFEKKLAEIPDPKTARMIGRLREILGHLSQLQEPKNLPDSLKRGGVIQEMHERLEDTRALNAAADQVVKDYQKILEIGKLVLDKKNEPNLPGRIREVLASAKNLKTPGIDKDKPLPGSDRLTFAAVFQLAEIQKLLEEWNKLKEKLEPAAKSDKRL